MSPQMCLVGAGGQFSPLMISGLQGWWDASDITTLISDGARQFTSANSEYLSIADNASLSTGDIDFTFTCWVYMDSLINNETILSKFNSATSREYQIILNTTPRFAFTVSDDAAGTNQTSVPATTLGLPAAATWYFIVAWHDATANTINIQVNDGGADSAAYSFGVFDGTASFNIGSIANPTNYFNGRIDSVGFWKRTLTAAEKTYLYNTGAGRTYAGIGVVGTDGSNLKTSLISWWNLAEPSGNATDQHGSNNLTDNNTVTAATGIVEGEPSNNDVITSWRDRSPNTRTLDQDTVANKPLYKAASQNGLGTVLFDGVNDSMLIAYTTAQPITRYAVLNQVTYTSLDRLIDGNTTSRLGFRQQGTSPNLRIVGEVSSVADNTDLAVNTWGVVTIIFNGASSSLQINNSTATTGNPGTADSSGIRLADNAELTAPGNIQFAEVIDYTGSHTAAEQTKVKNYLANKWGVTI